ncbi:hypothetical protein FH972_023234 [Carpinus fangiana]|uniref:Uncharacterized protein n=1 Tax=Carpinus fangiana TaxID=176857 RepID=A0A5N6KV83_9ROSI|nr:hypothetical protein FH972_023234 [Carpinus fangiana]
MREEQCLALKQVIGTTADSSNGFDHLESQRSFAFVAGAAAVLARVDENLRITQRFFRAKPTAGPINSNTPIYDSPTPAAPTSTFSRSRLGSAARESGVGLPPFDLSIGVADSPGNRGALRERAKAATCVSLSRDGKLLAIGESGHRPRVLVFSTSPEAPADMPLVAVSEHTYGVRCVAFSPDSQYLASLGEVNDGFLYIWRINRTTGSAMLQASNKCTSYIRQMAWMGNTLVTVGQRHVKVWRLNEEVPRTSPSKRYSDASVAFSSPSRTLLGRNCLLGSLLDKTFTCMLPVSPSKAIVCSEDGDLCLLDDVESSPRLQRVGNCRFRVNSAVRVGTSSIVVGGLEGEMKTLNIDALLQSGRTRTPTDPAEEQSLRPLSSAAHVLAMVPLDGDNILTLDSTRHMQILKLCLDADSTVLSCSVAHRYPAHGASILGVQPLDFSTEDDAAFLTYSAEGTVLFWNTHGACVQNLSIDIDQVSPSEDETSNELRVVKAFHGHDYIVSGDKLGIMKIYETAAGKLLQETRAHSAEITDFAVFQKDKSTIIASSGRDRMAQVFQLPGGKPEHCELTQTLDEHVGAVTGVAFSRDAQKLISSSSDRTIVVRESISGELGGKETTAYVIVRTITLKATPLSISLSPLNDDELLVSTIDRQISRYDVASGNQVTTFKATDGDGNESVIVGSAVYMPLGQRSGCIASVSGTDKSIRVYDDNGKLLGREYGHTEGVDAPPKPARGWRWDKSALRSHTKPVSTTEADGPAFAADAVVDAQGAAGAGDGEAAAAASEAHAQQIVDGARASARGNAGETPSTAAAAGAANAEQDERVRSERRDEPSAEGTAGITTGQDTDDAAESAVHDIGATSATEERRADQPDGEAERAGRVDGADVPGAAHVPQEPGDEQRGAAGGGGQGAGARAVADGQVVGGQGGAQRDGDDEAAGHILGAAAGTAGRQDPAERGESATHGQPRQRRVAGGGRAADPGVMGFDSWMLDLGQGTIL